MLNQTNSFADENKELGSFIELIPDATIVVNQNGEISLINAQAESMFQYFRNELLGKSIEILIPTKLRQVHTEHRQTYLRAPQTRSMGETMNLIAVRKDGTLFPVDISLSPLQTSEGTYVFTAIRDITNTKEAKDALQRSEQYARAILNSVSAHIAVLDQEGNIQEVNRGWRLFSKENGGSSATRDGVGLNYLQVCRQASGYASEQAGEIADGIEAVLRGDVDIFNREYPCHSPIEERWFLCQVTPMPIESGGVFVSHINITKQIQAQQELIRAYEMTLVGWSRAMDLRDNETEGHTQRVTNMTVRIARAMELDEEAIANIRRGALLHDMGKLGIPDSILLKPGKLTDEEWVIMRKHPQFAYEMLSPIDFLKSALDIPYSHHEKWDGTGYPRGLKGEEIPFAARIFAVADVWDALRSDRPYRKGWPVEKVREYICSEAGKHFDPTVVEAFVKILDNE
ncbi:MAG: PAS domain S-box protein [Anaerolineae bacterium]|jgi:PAS domain S-box-containing protein|nr:PAS domain S-box protein [Anaerolineae bacterium]